MKPLRFATQAEALEWLLEHGAGQALHLVVLHADDCEQRRDRACTCTPEAVVEDLTADNVLRAAGARPNARPTPEAES